MSNAFTTPTTSPTACSISTLGFDVDWELRIYRIKEGELDSWVDEWSTHVAPLRQRFGFAVLGPWIDGRTFVWLLGYGGSESFDAANERYYASDERKTVDPDPARHIEKQQHHKIRIE
jgi:hypothetical protein